MTKQRSYESEHEAEFIRQRRPHTFCTSIPTSSTLLLLLLFWINVPPIITTTLPPPPSQRLRPIILDESRCPLGWKRAGEECVQLQFLPTRLANAEPDCQRLGAKLVDILDKDGEPQAPLIEDISDILEEALNAGVPDQSWLIGSGSFMPEWDSASERVRFRIVPKSSENEISPALGLRRRRGQHLFELVLLSNSSAHPFVCALSPIWRRIRLYQQSLLPRGAPKLEEEPQQGYFYDPSSTNDSFLSLPCSASGDPLPTIRWFRNGGEEIDLISPNSPFIVSAGALLIPLSKLPSSSSASPVTFHCLATNPLGTVRSQMATVRPAFIEPFRESRLDAFPLISGASKGGGARLECNVPRHFPRSFSFSWVRGGSYEKFVEVSPRLFISMDGTLYFAYNLREDEDSYACTLTSAATQSAQHGPFFRLFLPLGHINPKQKRPPGKMQHPHSFPPRIDDFQPQLFPEVPTRGQSIYLECFAYGFPVPTYRWTRVDGLPLPQGRHKLLSFGRILRIDRVEVTDSGRFRCTVQNELGTASGELKVAIQAPPTLLLPLIDRMLAPGTPSATLYCHVADAANGPLQIEWFHDGIPLAPLLLAEQDRDRFKMDGNELVILNVQRKDSGIYQCSASNEVGSVSSSALLLVERLAPRFHANVFPSRLFIVEGSQLRLPCLFQSSPSGKAQWSRMTRLEGTDVERLESANSIVDGTVPDEEINLLALDNAHLMDSGLYQCEARTDSGMAQANVWIEVIPRPQVSIRSENGNEDSNGQNGAENRRLLTCELEMNCTNVGPDGCPEALFSWEFNDRPIRSLAFDGREGGIGMGQREQLMRRRHTVDGDDSKFVLNQQTQLELPAQFVKEQVGRFACNSLFGGAIAELEPPPLAIVPLKLSIQDVDHSTAKLLYRTVQSPIKHQGTAAAMKRRGFALDGKIEQPRIYQLEARTGRERRWRPVKKIKLNGDGEDGILADLSGQIQLDGLEPNERYQFRLRPDGDRVQSVSLSDWIQTPQSVPTQPVENLRFRMLDDRHILLEWDPIERGGHHSAPGLAYNVSWALGQNGGEIASELVNDARMVINLPAKEMSKGGGEEHCTILEVGIRPTNLMGPAKTATNTVIRASDKAPQRFAVDLRMETVNSTHLNLSWHWKGMDPCENVIGAKIVCIEEGNNVKNDREGEAEKSPNTSSFRGEVSQSVPADYVQWMVHSLHAEREYTCRVLAFDQYGRMGPSKAGNVARGRTAEQAPLVAPEIIYVLVKEAGIDGYALLLDWRAVALSNIGIGANNVSQQKYSTADQNVERARQRGYKIFVYVSETANMPIELTLTEAELHDAQRPSARIDGLRPMFFYGIQVAAFNPGGIGPRSERIPVRIGAREQSNPALFGHPQNGANKSGHFSTIFLLIFSASFILIQSTFSFRVIHPFLYPNLFPSSSIVYF